jgi:prepilin-type N-terminal cleavage/methylation domain-containing protein
MIKRGMKYNSGQAGFTMTELLITMVIFVIAIAAFVGVFIPLLNQFKQQSKVAETQIEGIVGLEILRKDIESAGFGLPWGIPAEVTYSEAASAPASTYNDSTANPPRGILSGNNVGFANVVNGSDYLVVKATSIGTDAASTKWTDVITLSNGNRVVRAWQTPARSPIEDLNDNDSVIVLIPSRGESNQRILVNNGTSYTAQFNLASFPVAYSPGTTGDVYLIYGVAGPGANPLRMPFNRADYYISTSQVPARCAPNTGVLTKAFISQADGTSTAQPLLDCVADVQVVYGLDNDNDGDFEPGGAGSTDGWGEDLTLLTAQQVRDQVKEVRVYILAHEGQKDATYIYPNNVVTVGEFGLGRTFDLQTKIGTGWQNYRWKLYTIVVKPRNLK